jgi:hypothetical protein
MGVPVCLPNIVVVFPGSSPPVLPLMSGRRSVEVHGAPVLPKRTYRREGENGRNVALAPQRIIISMRTSFNFLFIFFSFFVWVPPRRKENGLTVAVGYHNGFQRDMYVIACAARGRQCAHTTPTGAGADVDCYLAHHSHREPPKPGTARPALTGQLVHLACCVPRPLSLLAHR